MSRNAERKILSYLKTPYKGRYIDIGPAVGSSDKLWTISLNEKSAKTPILLLHGLAAGVALWCLNLDSLASRRPVHAIDLLGFGRSSRPQFSSDAWKAELQFIQSIEAWRREIKLNKMVLLGHSMGGFIATAYAIKYPDRVKHLILADPWGFSEKLDNTPSDNLNQPLFKAITYVGQQFNPLLSVRAVGPLGLGEWLIEKIRPDILKNFEPFLKEDINTIPQYIYECNSQTPSGESAFHAMMTDFMWAKYPMINRMNLLKNDVPLTLIYGSRSWIDKSSGEKIKHVRGSSSYVKVITIEAGHHLYADQAETFNTIVNSELSEV